MRHIIVVTATEILLSTAVSTACAHDHAVWQRLVPVESLAAKFPTCCVIGPLFRRTASFSCEFSLG
ncbi:MAG: hypothetical protein ACYTG0_06385 [Planctomycetota bacterium]